MKILANLLLILVLTAFFGGGAWYYSGQLVPEYQASTTLLFIQEQRPSLDPAATIRSAEAMAGNFSQVVMTEKFMDEVIVAEPGLAAKLPENVNERRELWQSMVSSKADGTFLHLDVFNPDPDVALKTVSAAASVLQSNTKEWHGGGSTVQVKIVDTPLTSEKPVRPNVILNTVLGALTGLILSVAYLLYQKYFFSRETGRLEVQKPTSAPAAKKPTEANPVNQDDNNLIEANFRFSDYAERIFVDRTGLYKDEQPRISLKSGVRVKATKQPYSWNLSASGQPAASLLTRCINQERNHYI